MHRVYLSPGMFGFGRLASYNYFTHVDAGLTQRFRDAGKEVAIYVVDVSPTASLRRRAARLADLVTRSCVDEKDGSGPIHLFGHSTGGLDARLVASPSTRLQPGPISSHPRLAWAPRLRSVTTLSTPHFGTPLATFFATLSGQRMLYALSALTVIALTVGSPPLAAASAVGVAISRLKTGTQLLDRSTEALLRVLDDARSREVREFLRAIEHDQGAVLQLTPEAMDLFVAGVEDRPDVRYQCVATMAPPPTPTGWARSLFTPWGAVSSSLFASLYGLTARSDVGYPCVSEEALTKEATRALTNAFGRVPGARANDGVVPIRSQVWGELVWTGHGDHLDVLGHFAGGDDKTHVDWMASGSHFDRSRFDGLLDAVVRGMLGAAS